MDFLDDLGKNRETVKVVGDKSQQIVEISKMNIEIGKEEAIIKNFTLKSGGSL